MRSKVVICRANPLAPDPRVDKIARALVNGGYEVMAVGWDMSAQFASEERANGYTIRRLSVHAEFGRGLSNIRHQFRWQLTLLKWLVEHRRNYQIIHACDFDTVLPALLCKAFFRKKVVYDIFDFYAEMLRATPASVVTLIRKIDFKAINQVDAVILADDSRFRQIEGSKPKVVEVVYNTTEDVLSDLTLDRTHENAPFSLQITYVGNIQEERGLLILLDVLKDHSDWSLDLAGFGGDEALIQSEARKLPNVTWRGRVSYEEGLQLSHNADVLFATYDPDVPNNRYASPNKMFEAMMLGKPIIVAYGTNMDRIIQNEDCGLIVEYGSRQDLEASLSKLDDESHLRQRLGENARKAFEKEYNWESMKRRLLKLYGEIANT
jgi:glycosyltransferase involved in cell wall biosynthesis